MTPTDTAPPTGSLLANVIHPTDFSPEGDPAFCHALKIALAAGGHLSLAHATDSAALGNEWSAFPGVRDRLTQWGLLAAGAPQEAVAAQLGLRVTKADLGGSSPVEALAAYLDRHPCDLMVLATHARVGLGRLVSPAVAEPLARTVRSPALFLPAGAPGFVDAGAGHVRLRNILMPIDLSPDPSRGMAAAGQLARLLGAKDITIHLLHVGEGHPSIPQAPDGALVEFRRADGPVVDAICKAAVEVDADLIVMTTHGHDGILDVFRGSTTEQVLRRSGRPMLAVPAE